MGTDFYSLNKVILAGQVFQVTNLDKKKKTQCIRLRTKEVFLYGPKKNKDPTSYYHLVKTTGSLAEFCAKYIVPGDVILVEGRLRSFPSTQDKTVWKSIIWADKVITITKKEWLKDDRKEKTNKAK
jgi:single-stranded DNA-binding protein